MFIKKYLLFRWIIIFCVANLCFLSNKISADAIQPISNLSVGSYILYGGKTWILLDPQERILFLKDSASYLQKWDNSSNLFDSSAIYQYLNTTFYDSLSNKELIESHEWIDKTSKVVAPVGLLSTKQFDLAQSRGLFNTDTYNQIKSLYFWLLDSSPNNDSIAYYATYAYSDHYVISPNGNKITVGYNTHPIIYLKDTAFTSGGSGTITDPYTLTDVNSEINKSSNDSKVAAQNAQSAANAAKTAAESTNTIVNNSLTISAGVVQDSSGTVLSEARLAKAKADLAATNAANAKTSADNAKTAADNAKTAADTAATKAGQAVTSITTAESNLTTKLNNVESKLNNVQTNLTNISTLLPPILSDVTGYNSATATTSTSFKVSLDYSNATEYRYKLDSGSWSAWTSLSTHDTNGYLTVPVSTNGAHNLSIEIRNSSTSLTAKGKMTFFKL